MSLPLPQVLAFLKLRSALRVIVVVGFYGCIAMAIAKWLWGGSPLVDSSAWLVAMALLGVAAVAGGFLLRVGRCPRCGAVFAVRADRKLANNFTSQCLNCGLRLDGSNAAEPLI